MKYSVTRQKILTAAYSLLGIRFLHQGRNPEVGLDCVGVIVEIGKRINYPQIVDAEAYRRVPSASTIRETLLQNCDEIELSEAKPGDIFQMRLHGRKPRHCAVYYSDEVDEKNGIEPTILHASPNGVKIEPISNFPKEWFVSAYRVRGLKD